MSNLSIRLVFSPLLFLSLSLARARSLSVNKCTTV